ncbi:MAG: protein kinase [Anaerolineales bacterium]|nr:protein kinase [Anaerolineales bacterium]
MALQTGQTLNNRYRIVRLLGQGGFGAVYRAWDANLNRPCAVKENLDTSPEAQRQFAREATVLANLSHPNLPRVTDHFSLPGQGQYLVMDFVDGDDLHTIMKRQGSVPVDQAVGWISQVADALVYLHSREPHVVHRDIKPANIRITPEGQAMLVDFGLVKLFDPHMKTTIGARAVTPGYAPPEQYGQGKTDARTDLYALGATLYNILTGQDPLESVQRMVGRRMEPANQINPAIPAQISQAIERAMALEPDQRFQSAEQFKAALTARPVPASANIPSQPRRPEPTMITPPMYTPQVQSAQSAPARSYPSVAQPAAPSVVRRRKPAPAAKPKRGGFAAGFGVIAMIILCIGVALGAYAWYTSQGQSIAQATSDQATLDVKVRTTSTARAQATAAARAGAASTAQAQETTSARAQATATLQARLMATQNALSGYVAKVLESRQQVFGPTDGQLDHNQADGLITLESSSVDLKNFMVEGRFFNPFAASRSSWDYGLLFRSTGKDNQYRLVIKSSQTWVFVSNSGDPDGIIISEGDLPDLDVSDGGSNFIRLICQEDNGLFYLNDNFVAELDLSGRMFSGDILIATGVYYGDELDGETTRYQGFAVWSIP